MGMLIMILEVTREKLNANSPESLGIELILVIELLKGSYLANVSSIPNPG